jgi:prepilin-type processing-associated H-X9-DG protein
MFAGAYETLPAHVAVFPFMEQESRYSRTMERDRQLKAAKTTSVQRAEAGLNAWADNADNREVFGTPVSTLLCPSDGNAAKRAVEGYMARSNIVTCRGDRYSDNYPSNPRTSLRTITNTAWRGAFATHVYFSLASLSDGTSNTILVSETVTPNKSGSLRIKGGATTNPLMNASGIPENCKKAIDSTDSDLITGTGAINLYRGYIADGRTGAGGFVTVLPPNSPSCLANSPGAGAESSGIFSVSSEHTGGVNVGLGDGSVRFVSSTIEAGDAAKLEVTSGASPYGVWGNLGVKDSGQSVSF